MNILRALLIVQLHHAWTLNVTLNGWRLHVHNPNRSIDEAIKDYFSTKTRLLSVAVHLQYSQYWQNIINDYLTDVLRKSESMSFKIHISKSRNKRNHEVYPYNLWYVDSHLAFRALLPDFRHYRGSEIGQYMIVMQLASKLELDQELQHIFQTAFKHNIVNIAVAVYATDILFVLYSYDIFKPGQCRLVIPRQINYFRNGNFDSTELFPYQFGNFHKCPITLFVPYTFPYFIFNLTEDGQSIDHYSGSEGLLIDTLAEHFNFDLRFYYKELHFSGTVYKNGTATGPFRVLQDGHIDILLGYFQYMARSQHFTGTQGYFITPIVIVYHENDRNSPFHTWLEKPFQNRVWLVIFIVLGIGMLVTIYLQYRYRRHKGFPIHVSWLDMLGLALGNSRPLKLRLVTTKYAIIMWTIGFMNFCAIFQGKLYDAFNRRPTSNPATLQQLIDSNYTFLMREYVEKDIVATLNIPQDLLHYLPTTDDFEIYNQMLEYNGNVATITNYRQFLAYVNKKRLYAEFNLVSQNVVTNQICAYLRHHSYLHEPITRIISNLNSGGIMTKWTNDEMLLDASNTLKQMRDDNLDHEPVPLSYLKIRRAFMGLTVSNFFSILVFLGEIIVHKFSSRIN